MVEPFPIEAAEVATPEAPEPAKVVRRRPRFQALNEDMIWIAEQDIARMKSIMQRSTVPMTDKEHARFIKTAEQLRKLRLTDAELNKMQDPGAFDDTELDAEFNERCETAGLDADKVREVLGL